MEQPDPPGEDANSEAGATNGAVGRASIPAEDAATAPTPTPKFTRPPGMPAPPDSLDDATRPDGGTPGPAPLAPTETTGSVTASAKVPQSSGRAAVNLSVPTSGIGSPGGYGGSGFHSSGSGATSVLGAAGTGTIPTRPGAPGVPDGGRSAAARATTLGRASTARVAEAVRSARSTVAAATRGPRRARLFVKRIDPWSVMKFAFAVSFVLFFVAIIATTVLYLALDAMGVFDSLNKTIADMLG
ncbi:MAG: DUF3566 domain-containing protein, partial [Micromonosporaceae bacterium]|nr:DUF3566 domain-containing protein [Micromonosporaceae bacterium]